VLCSDTRQATVCSVRLEAPSWRTCSVVTRTRKRRSISTTMTASHMAHPITALHIMDLRTMVAHMAAMPAPQLLLAVCTVPVSTARNTRSTRSTGAEVAAAHRAAAPILIRIWANKDGRHVQGGSLLAKGGVLDPTCLSPFDDLSSHYSLSSLRTVVYLS